MFALALTLVLSQHGPKIIDLGKPVPVRQENVVRPSRTKRVVKEGEAEAAAAPAPTSAAAEAKAEDARVQAKEEQAAKEQERRKQDLRDRAEANDELWRKSADALGGVK